MLRQIISKRECYERIRHTARMISDKMQKSPGGDQYTFTGSTNLVDNLREALSEFDWEHDAEFCDDVPEVREETGAL